MTEAQLQSAVIDCAHSLGWIVAHFRPAKTEKGWRTPVQADGKGFPDLVMVHRRQGRLIVAELKSARGETSPEQEMWLDAFLAVSVLAQRVEVFQWRPADWLNGYVEIALRPPATNVAEAAA